MAQPINDIPKDDNAVSNNTRQIMILLVVFLKIYMLDDNGEPMQSMIALYWKVDEYVYT